MKLAISSKCGVRDGFGTFSAYCDELAGVLVYNRRGILQPFCQEHFEALQERMPKLVVIDLGNGKRD